MVRTRAEFERAATTTCALLVLYQANHAMMVTAAETVPGTDPDRAGFTIVLEAARDSVTNATNITQRFQQEGMTGLADLGAAAPHQSEPSGRARHLQRRCHRADSLRPERFLVHHDVVRGRLEALHDMAD